MRKIIFLPGTLCNERLWGAQLQEFTNSQVINLRNQESFDEMLNEIEQAITQPVFLVGFSMGGYIAQEFALRNPGKIEKLVLIGSPSDGYPPAEREVVLKNLPLIIKGKFTGITDKRLRDYLHKSSYENEQIRRLIQSMAGADAKEVYLRQLRITLDRRNLLEDMKTFFRPTLIIGGMNDAVTYPSSLRRSAEVISGSQLVLVENCGHFVPIEKPIELNRILRNFFS